MLRQALENISEAKQISAKAVTKIGVHYDEIMDWLDANGGYESLDEFAKGNFGYKSSWSSENGSIYSLTKSEFSKLEKAISDIAELVEVDGNVDFSKIYSKKSFSELGDKGKLAVVYHWLSGQTDIQPSNINDLVVSVSGKKAVFTSNSSTVDVGDKSISGMEDLPFGLKFSELKKIVKKAL